MHIVDRVGQLLEIFLSERLVQFMFSNHLGLFTTLCQLQGNVEVVPSKDASLQSDDVGIVN